MSAAARRGSGSASIRSCQTSSFAEIVVVSKDVEARERIKARLEQAVADGALSEARVRVDRFNFGPPVGFPVQFRVIGPDTKKVRDIAYQVREVMRANDQVIDPHLDWNEQAPYLKLVVDQDRVRAMGLTPQDISQSLSMLISGLPITTVRDGIEKVAVVARAVPAERLDLAHIGDLSLYSRNGVAVPLSQIAHIEYTHEEPIMWRLNRDMAITVRSDVVDGVQPPDVTNAIWPKLQSIRDSLEPAYRIEIGGAIEESQKGNASIFVLFPVMIMAMLTLLMIQLQSISRLILVFLTAPLGIVGASLGLNVANQPFGFVALLGLIALAGMIMRNAVILVDQIEIGRQSRVDPPRCDRGSDRPAGAARHPHGAGSDLGHDPPVALALLGADGDHHHGRPLRRDLFNTAVPAKPLCVVVSQAARRARRRGGQSCAGD